MKRFSIIFTFTILYMSCSNKPKTATDFESYLTSANTNLWLDYCKETSEFKIWAPAAEGVQLHFYNKGNGGERIESHRMEASENGVWVKKLEGDLHGTYYTFQVIINGGWLEETPGIYAKTVGVNGMRAMVLDFGTTDPLGWENDKGPQLNYPNEAIIYEMHIRDFTIHPQSGSSIPGKYLGLVEHGTKDPNGIETGLDHLKALGITHVHLLPAFDHSSINEDKLDETQYNWGYDPQNYNVPEGSYASNPYHAEIRVKEFKQMVKSFHENGIGVILDVVYNHTGRLENFNLEVPGYYYRHWEDGTLSNASDCGNEVASERTMARKFIVESVAYWAKEYHLDGFRFDLMGILDIDTMNDLSNTLKSINPNIIIYGEGWFPGKTPLPTENQAIKKNMDKMPQMAAFSDEFRDGIKGSVFEAQSTGFVNGANNMEDSVKFGLVGAINHPQIDYGKVNYSQTPWSAEPWQSVSYVSCHDNHTLFDKLKISRPDATITDLIAMDKLANAIVMTSQGIAFMHAGAELLRTKDHEDNSYNLPDAINQMDWNRKYTHSNVFEYYKNLIQLRKSHPAFRMTSADAIRNNLRFETSENGLISYIISNHTNNDDWKNILVIYNARQEAVAYKLKEAWELAVIGDDFNLDGIKTITEKIDVPAISMLIAFQK